MNKGDFVRIEYVGRLESGEIFDVTSEEEAKKNNVYNKGIKYRAIPVIVDAGFVIKGLDKALKEMSPGEKKTVDIKPEDGFGQRDPRLVRVVPRKAFRDRSIEPVPAMIVDFSGVKGRIQSVSAGRVMVDFNNPLAGKTLKYELEIREKIENTDDKIKAIFEFFGIDKITTKTENTVLDIETIRLPAEVKDRISSLIIEHITGIEKVRFLETYEKSAGKVNKKKE
jgi:FKBP-type peptidyl-prolyl cis-trans isomerase SlyD